MTQLLLSKLKSAGYKQTKIRVGLLQLLTQSKVPLTAFEIQTQLAQSANRATIYRELDLLVRAGFVQSVHFQDGKSRFEIPQNHHHHLVCDNCGKVEDVSLPESLLSRSLKTNFKVLRHSLEFFGLCEPCQTHHG